MSKNHQQSQTDTADLLAERQARVMQKIYQAIQGTGFKPEEWINLITLELSKATRGYISDHLHEVLDNFTDYAFYKSPYRLSKLVKLLRREFYGVQRQYTQAGRLQMSPEGGDINIRTTLSDPVNIQESLPGVKTK